MALVINNRVRELTSTTGTGAVTLGGAVGGFQTFAAGIGNSNTTYYAISLNTANEWEVGLGTLNSDSSTLTRTTVLESSNSDSAVDFAAGSKEIFCTLPSEKAVYLDASDAQVGGFSSLADDSSPQLGGDLDVVTYDIVSTSNRDIDITPHGTGDVVLKADTVTVGDAAAAATLRSSGAGTLTVTTGGATDLILSTNNGTTSGTITITDAANGAINLTPNGTGNVQLYADEVTIGDSGATATLTSNGTGDLLLNTNSGTDSSAIQITDAADGDITFTNNGSGNVVFNDAAYNPETSLTDAATITWDVQAMPITKVTLTDNRILAAPTNGAAGQFISLLIIQDGTGSRTVTWNAAFEFPSDTAPTLTTTADLGDMFVFRYHNSKWLQVGATLALTVA